MKKFVVLMLLSGFVSVTANAQVGRNDAQRVDCSKVIQTLQEALKRNRPADGPSSPTATQETGTVRPAQ